MMKQTSWISLAVLTLAVFISSCTGNGNQQPNNEEISNNINGIDSERRSEVTLNFWRNSGNVSENMAYEKLVSTFMENNPDISIVMTPIHYADYDTKLRTSIASGDFPDIMALDASSMASFAHAGALKPLTAYFKVDGDLADIPQTTLATYTYQNDIYMAPLNESSIAMFYNKKMFKEKGIPFPSKNPEEPWTWDQVLEAAIKLNDPENGIYGIDPAQGFQNYGATAYFKYPIIWQFGGEVMSPDGSTARGYLDSPETKRALRFYSDLYNKHKVSAFEYPADPFPNGNLGITIEGSWSLSYLNEKFPDFKLGEDYDIAPLPKQDKQAVANGSWALGISSKSKYSEEAWKFVNWVTSHEGQVLYCSITKDIPVRYSAAKEFPELNEYPKNIFVIQNQKFGRPRPITQIFPQLAEAVNKLFEEVTIGKKDLDTSIETAIRTVDREYAQMR